MSDQHPPDCRCAVCVSKPAEPPKLSYGEAMQVLLRRSTPQQKAQEADAIKAAERIVAEEAERLCNAEHPIAKAMGAKTTMENPVVVTQEVLTELDEKRDDLVKRFASRCGYCGEPVHKGPCLYSNRAGLAISDLAGFVPVEQERPPDRTPLHRLGEVPRALRALASQIAYGSTKPGRSAGDWRAAYGSEHGRAELVDKILRHALALAAGELLDDDGRPHAAAVLADAAFLLELEGT